MRILFLLFVLIAIWGFSCEESINPGSAFDLQDTLTLELNTPRYNAEYQFGVNFKSIESDSRCPMDANCIWAGNAQVELEYLTNDSSSTLILNTFGGLEYPSEVSYADLTFSLVQVFPYPCVSCQTPDKESLTLVIRKNN